MDEFTPKEQSRDASYERRDLDPHVISLFAAVLTATILVVAAGTFWMVRYQAARYAARQPAPSPLAHTREPTPEPRLQVGGARELAEMREEEDVVLQSYAWIDRDKGMVRIPIERAMEMLAEKEGGRR
jgi:hypothetical protein